MAAVGLDGAGPCGGVEVPPLLMWKPTVGLVVYPQVRDGGEHPALLMPASRKAFFLTLTTGRIRAEWDGGRNEFWADVFAELDRLEGCRNQPTTRPITEPQFE